MRVSLKHSFGNVATAISRALSRNNVCERQAHMCDCVSLFTSSRVEYPNNGCHVNRFTRCYFYNEGLFVSLAEPPGGVNSTSEESAESLSSPALLTDR